MKALIAKKFIKIFLFLSISINTLNLLNVCQANAQTLGESLDRIRKQAEEDEAQVERQLLEFKANLSNEEWRTEFEKRKVQVRNDFLELLNDEKKYQKLLESPTVSESQKVLLRKFKLNPQELDRYINQRSDPKHLEYELKLRIRQNRELEIKRAKERALRNRLSPSIK